MTLNEDSKLFASYVAEFGRRRVLVLGDAIVDEYLYGSCSRISPEAPVPVLRVAASRFRLGGAANTAANVVALGAQATLIALIGDDQTGTVLRQCAVAAGIVVKAVDHGCATLRKTRVVGQQQQIVRLDYEDIREHDAAVEEKTLRLFDAHVQACDIVVVSDYAKGFLTEPLCHELIRRAHAAGREVVIDPRPQHRDYYYGCDYLTPNWREGCALLGWPETDPTPETVSAVARELASQLETSVVLTLGPHGISFCDSSRNEQFAMPTLAKEVFDVSGAGDTVVATFALSHASGADHRGAVALANRAASVVVGKSGTAVVTPDEILQGGDGLRLVSRSALVELTAALHAKGRRIVTTVGTFNTLRQRDLRFLSEARQRGDVLIVGLYGDAAGGGDIEQTCSAPQLRRAEMLLALRAVDYVYILEDADPGLFLAAVRPAIHVDGHAKDLASLQVATVTGAGSAMPYG